MCDGAPPACARGRGRLGCPPPQRCRPPRARTAPVFTAPRGDEGHECCEDSGMKTVGCGRMRRSSRPLGTQLEYKKIRLPISRRTALAEIRGDHGRCGEMCGRCGRRLVERQRLAAVCFLGLVGKDVIQAEPGGGGAGRRGGGAAGRVGRRIGKERRERNEAGGGGVGRRRRGGAGGGDGAEEGGGEERRGGTGGDGGEERRGVGRVKRSCCRCRRLGG